jgi:hypothetical protein
LIINSNDDDDDHHKMAASGDECAAASTAAPPITTLVGSSAGSSGFGISTDDGMEGEDDGEPCPKVSSSATVNKMDGALMAQRNTSPYAKPQGERYYILHS